ncbi:hypothetical protein BGZ83_004214, partial [Gryganskiella cystojenkinii]
IQKMIKEKKKDAASIQEPAAASQQPTLTLNTTNMELSVLVATRTLRFQELYDARIAERNLLDEVQKFEQGHQHCKDAGYYWRKYAEAAETVAKAAAKKASEPSTGPTNDTEQADTSTSSSSPLAKKSKTGSSRAKGKALATALGEGTASSSTATPDSSAAAPGTSPPAATLKFSEPTLWKLGMQQRTEKTSLLKLRAEVRDQEQWSRLRQEEEELTVIAMREQALDGSGSLINGSSISNIIDMMPMSDDNSVVNLKSDILSAKDPILAPGMMNDATDNHISVRENRIKSTKIPTKAVQYEESLAGFDPGIVKMLDGVAVTKNDVHRIVDLCHKQSQFSCDDAQDKKPTDDDQDATTATVETVQVVQNTLASSNNVSYDVTGDTYNNTKPHGPGTDDNNNT